jgi:DNA polymerase-3 subunit gamma/tau
MSYLVLARKWRPQTFEDVVGQESVVRTLRRGLETGRVAHAFLFTGSRGVGKTTLARLMAKALTCEKGITPDPCGTCQFCLQVAEGSSVDVVEIDGASNTGVDDVRDLREAARYQPSAARFKIFIIDEVHMLSISAFNALLKILEEPPDHVKFIFATTEPHKIPITILSRCQRYDFKRLSNHQIAERLAHVLEQEKVTINPAGLMVIAQAAEGGMRDALSLTDQVLSFVGDGATADQVREALGLMDRRSIWKLVKGILERDGRSSLEVVARAHATGHEMRQLVDGLAREFRNLTVAASLGSARDFVDLPEEDIQAIDDLATAQTGPDLQRLFAMALDGADEVARSDESRLAAELLVLRMVERPLLAEAATIAQAIARLESLVRAEPGGAGTGPLTQAVNEAFSTPQKKKPSVQLKADSPPPKATLNAPPTAVAPIEAPPPPPPDLDIEEPDDADAFTESEEDDPAFGLSLKGADPTWVKVVDALGEKDRPMAVKLEQAQVLRDGNAFRLFFKQSLHRKQAQDMVDAPALADALKSAAGAEAKVEISDDDGSPDAAMSIVQARQEALERAEAALSAHARENPTVQRALELFGGEVREVRRQKRDRP